MRAERQAVDPRLRKKRGKEGEMWYISHYKLAALPPEDINPPEGGIAYTVFDAPDGVLKTVVVSLRGHILLGMRPEEFSLFIVEE